MRDVEVDWKAVLSSLGLRTDKRELSILCPLHNDSSPSATINVDKGLFHCFAGCRSGSIRIFLKAYLGYGQLELDLFLRSFKLKEETSIWKEDLFLKEEVDDFQQPEIIFPFKQDVVPSWIFKRGFNKVTLRKWGCGMSDDNALAVPIKDDNGRLVGWVTRSDPAKGKVYLYSSGLKTSKVLFGSYNIKSEQKFVCLTEGTLDTMWLDQNGIPSVALLGLNLSKHQEQLISRLPTSEIVLCLDNDDAGKVAAKNISVRLSNYFPISFIELPKSVKDVQDVRESKEIINIVSRRTTILMED